MALCMQDAPYIDVVIPFDIENQVGEFLYRPKPQARKLENGGVACQSSGWV